MWKLMGSIAILALTIPGPVWAQQQDFKAEIRNELADLQSRIARLEALLVRMDDQATPNIQKMESMALTNFQASLVPPPPARQAPALNTPPKLPRSVPESYAKDPPRFDILIQTRADFPADNSRNDTFYLRKAEIGVKGNIAPMWIFLWNLKPLDPTALYAAPTCDCRTFPGCT